MVFVEKEQALNVVMLRWRHGRISSELRGLSTQLLVLAGDVETVHKGGGGERGRPGARLKLTPGSSVELTGREQRWLGEIVSFSLAPAFQPLTLSESVQEETGGHTLETLTSFFL